MIKTRICAECQRQLLQATEAMRYHEARMHKGLELNEQGYLTEEFRRELAPVVVESFNTAQAAWDAYQRARQLWEAQSVTQVAAVVQEAVAAQPPELPLLVCSAHAGCSR